MNGISRSRNDDTFGNSAIDLTEPGLGKALEGAGLDLKRLDALDGKADARVSGQQAIDDLYDEINRLDARTPGLASKQERAVWTALRGAEVAPVPISPEQGAALAAAARQLVAEDHPPPGQLSHWSKEGVSACENPALSAPTYAISKSNKCNVFVGEAFHRAGVPFPLNEVQHYERAKALPSDARFFQRLASIDQVRPGDLISIDRTDGSAHIEVVTAVARNAGGRVTSISSAGAHAAGSGEGPSTATPLLRHAEPDRSPTVIVGSETYRLLRPMAPPAPEGAK